ncbi:testis-specific serine/threonine-protein kinase 1-like [Ctenocephalides felis]|uniref:testis-specific serine/threonine-protein kinase 1-like n=1 Tax=Ctenocephalides felis TaxID=7515 RepID=UPI000E6E1690|nr:testis-specific serine/threonine-protein kinase 1-like [Ctenocephalides felis]
MTEIIKTSPSEETTLHNRGYKLTKKLGEGSYAKVYLGEFKTDSESDKKYQLACKIVDTTKAPKDFVKKFLPRELEILIKLNHPHVVHVHSIFQRRAKYYIFMRFAENGDLLEFVLKNGSVAENQARVWLRQVALAIQYLHEMEIAHRDLKCENILLTNNFNVKVADFGFARYVMDFRTKRLLLSETYCGSLSYAAPEILKGTPYNPKIADLWSLGVVLYIMLNKAMPFDDTNIKRLHEQQINRRWKFRARVVDALSEQVKKCVINMMEPEPSKRWRIDQVVQSDWIGMDSRLLGLNSAENAALTQAIEERRRMIQEGEMRNPDGTSSRPIGQTRTRDMSILKEGPIRKAVSQRLSDDKR